MSGLPASAPLTIAMVAGEASGDMLGANLIEAIQAPRPDAVFIGIGGPRMQSAGLHSLFPQETLAVRGYVEVICSLPAILSIRRGLVAALLARRPDVFIGVDAPDFNLDVEIRLKKAGIRTIHYVSPSIWVWRAERIHKIKRAVNHVLALFPLEEPIYQAAGIPVTYVGHPLAEKMPIEPDFAAARAQLRITPPSAPVFALLPGSRRGEVETMAPLFIEAARLIVAEVPDAQFLVPLATRPTLDLFERILIQHHATDLPMVLAKPAPQPASQQDGREGKAIPEAARACRREDGGDQQGGVLQVRHAVGLSGESNRIACHSIIKGQREALQQNASP